MGNPQLLNHLHTNSAVYNKNSEYNNILRTTVKDQIGIQKKRLDNQIKTLQAVESRFYQKYTGNPSCNTFDQFIDFMRISPQDSKHKDPDAKCYELFSNFKRNEHSFLKFLRNNYKGRLSLNINGQLYSAKELKDMIGPKTFQININTQSAKQKLSIYRNQSGITKKGKAKAKGNYRFIDFNEVINTVLDDKTGVKTLTLEEFDNFIDDTVTAVNEIIKEKNHGVKDKNNKFVIIGREQIAKKIWEIDSVRDSFQQIKNMSFLKGHSSKEIYNYTISFEEQQKMFTAIRVGNKNKGVTNQQLLFEDLHDFILYHLCAGHSKKFEEVFNYAWNLQITPKIRSYNYFQIGKGNQEQKLNGLFGEFFTVMLDYQKTGLNTHETEWVGQQTNKYGEKMRSDINFIFKEKDKLSTYGVQVKNWKENSLKDDFIGGFISKLHPDMLIERLSQLNRRDNFIPLMNTLMANYAFNADFHNNITPNLIFFLQQEIGALLNFRMVDNLEIEDMVSFYLVGGKFIVPGSMILESFKDKDKIVYPEIKINIPTPVESLYDDKNFMKKRNGEDGHNSPKAFDYWYDNRRGPGFDWIPYENRQQTEINNLLNHKSYTIHTKFRVIKIINFLQTKGYALF